MSSGAALDADGKFEEMNDRTKRIRFFLRFFCTLGMSNNQCAKVDLGSPLGDRGALAHSRLTTIRTCTRELFFESTFESGDALL